ncbi:hypothetical protein [Lysobacter humi (ex Lee et al. 2017)]
MELFRSHGLVSVEPQRGARASYGARARRRYGRLHAGATVPHAAVPTERTREDDLFPWVDQDFEEYFFE